MDSNSKASYDLYLKTAAASVLNTPSTASPHTDLSSGHTTGSAGKNSFDNHLDFMEQCKNENVFFHNWPVVSSEETTNVSYSTIKFENPHQVHQGPSRCSPLLSDVFLHQVPIKVALRVVHQDELFLFPSCSSRFHQDDLGFSAVSLMGALWWISVSC